MDSPVHRTSPYRTCHFNQRPPTPPGTFRNSSLWRSENIDLGPSNDSDAHLAKDDGFLSKTSDSDDRLEDERARRMGTPRSMISKSIQVDDVHNGDECDECCCAVFGDKNHVRDVSSPRNFGCQVSGFCPDRRTEDGRLTYNVSRSLAKNIPEANGVSLRCCSPPCLLAHDKPSGFQQSHHPAPRYVYSSAGVIPVACRPAHHKEMIQQRRKTASKSLDLDGSCTFLCSSSPYPSDWSTASTCKTSSRRTNVSLSDTNASKSKRVNNGYRVGRCSDSSTSSVSNVGTTKRKVRSSNRVRSSSRNNHAASNPGGPCTYCNDMLPFCDQRLHFNAFQMVSFLIHLFFPIAVLYSIYCFVVV